MKFTDGFWVVKPEMRPNYPMCAFDAEPFENGVRIYCPFREQEGRGATIDCGMLTVDLTSPMEDVIYVNVHHFMGGLDNKPAFELYPQAVEPSLAIGQDSIEYLSGSLKAVVTRNPYSIAFYQDGRLLTESSFRNLAYMQKLDGPAYMVEQLKCSVGEYIYGLGERFTPFVKNGQVVEMWNEDGGTASEIAYKNIPFYLSSRGYGVFCDHPEKVFYEICSEKVGRVSFGVEGERLGYYLVGGPKPMDALKRYVCLTGKPALPPAASFGLWLSTSFTTDYDEKTVLSFIDGMAERNIPLHVFHFDCFWMREYNWCDFEWDSRIFPEPEAMLRRYKARGLKICVWINPYIAQRSPLFEEGKRNGYLVKNPDGSVWQWDRWQAGMGLVDFTNPAACDWYRSKLKALLDMGVDYFKTDFGERIPTNVRYYNGADPVAMHNYYTSLYNRCVFELIQKEKGEGEACLFARSATAGGQRFPVHWGGDCSGTYDSMAETLRGGLSLAASGFAFWSHDMAGFEQTASPDIYKRWAQFGLLSTHSRLHGSKSYRVPWYFGEESCDVVRYFVRLKCRLMPYLFGQAVEAHRTGAPVLRPMFLSFPEDNNCLPLDRQYMLGSGLLVAPIFNEESMGEYYLPDGLWTHLLSGETRPGGRWHRESYDYFSLPLFVRPGSLLALGSNEERPDYDYARGVELHLYQLADGQEAACAVPDQEGGIALRAKVRRKGERLTAQTDQPCTLVVHENGQERLRTQLAAGETELAL